MMKRHDEIHMAAGQIWSPLALSRSLYWAIGQQSDMFTSVDEWGPYLSELRLLVVECRRALRVVGHIARRIRV